MLWLSPAGGSSLVAGETVEIGWAADPDAPLPGDVEEWEVFLSLDGGRHWSVRLTPHLGIERRRFVVRIPDLPTDDARLLLRVGDERREHEIVLPGRLRIQPAKRAKEAEPGPWPALDNGESARSGAPGVTLWAAAGRSGRNVRWFVHVPEHRARPSGYQEGRVVPLPLRSARPRSQPPRSPAPRLGDPGEASHRPPVHAGDADSAEPLPPLLATCRLNT